MMKKTLRLLLVLVFFCSCILTSALAVNPADSNNPISLGGTDSDSPWPYFNMTGSSVWLFSASNAPSRTWGRLFTVTGPSRSGKPYAGAGAFNSVGVGFDSVVAFFYESGSGGDYIYAEIIHALGYTRRLYFKASPRHLTGLQRMNFEGVDGTLTKDVVPVFGPGKHYDTLKRSRANVTLIKGLSVTVLCEENDYLFIDCESPIGKIRIWVPSDAVMPA